MRAPSKAVKYALTAFVAVSIGAAAYKALPCRSGDNAQAGPAVEAGAPALAQVRTYPPQGNVKAGKPAAAKTAVVYYFYTDTRCSSCQTIEAYTREAVEKELSAGYGGWTVVFSGVNIDDEANEHFVQDYRLNSKAVIVQKFSGDKPLNWGKLDRIWTLIGDKDAFVSYIVSETHKLLDEK